MHMSAIAHLTFSLVHHYYAGVLVWTGQRASKSVCCVCRVRGSFACTTPTATPSMLTLMGMRSTCICHKTTWRELRGMRLCMLMSSTLCPQTASLSEASSRCEHTWLQHLCFSSVYFWGLWLWRCNATSLSVLCVVDKHVTVSVDSRVQAMKSPRSTHLVTGFCIPVNNLLFSR